LEAAGWEDDVVEVVAEVVADSVSIKTWFFRLYITVLLAFNTTVLLAFNITQKTQHCILLCPSFRITFSFP
jgi:hypothetical protein